MKKGRLSLEIAARFGGDGYCYSFGITFPVNKNIMKRVAVLCLDSI